jgi:3-hydroxyisobutyrate dehydrogenase
VSTRVAILGTGRMGSALARRLAGAGLEPTLWNRTRARAEQAGVGRVVDTPAEAVRDADVVITSLTGADAVRAEAPLTGLVRELVGEAAADVAGLDITAVITRYRPVTAAPTGTAA